jgi:hypothetical protein
MFELKDIGFVCSRKPNCGKSAAVVDTRMELEAHCRWFKDLHLLNQTLSLVFPKVKFLVA